MDPKRPRDTPRIARASWAWAAAVGAAATLAFGFNLDAEPHFVDESAYIASSSYADLWLEGRRDDRAWFGLPAIDQPPLCRYLVGGALRLSGYRRPGPSQATSWYLDNRTRPETPEMLRMARLPSVALGAMGCVAVFAIGAMASGRRVGALAAGLLALNPLYGAHARRAMTDVPCEALMLASAAVGLWAWKRTLAGRIGPFGWAASGAGAGVLAALATLAKLTGGLSGLTLAAWATLAAVLPGVPARRKLALAVTVALASAMAVATFIPLYPTLTARPDGPLSPTAREFLPRGVLGRLRLIYRHRRTLTDGQTRLFPNDALAGPLQKAKVAIVQGYGRFGPLGPRHADSRARFDWGQDAGALFWGPWVALGAAWAFVRGRRQLREGLPPAWWAVLLQAALALASVVAYIPLAWDRYLLPIQSGSALLAAGVAVGTFDGLIVLTRRRPPRVAI